MVFWILVLVARLHIMVVFAQRLPVRQVPEKLRVTTVGTDVVNDCRQDILAFAFALRAQWMGAEELLGQALPLGTVATGSSGPRVFRM